MITNERILGEILIRKRNALKEIEESKLPAELIAILNYIKNEEKASLVTQMIKQLKIDFPCSIEEKDIQFAGYEWDQSGGIIGFCGKECKQTGNSDAPSSNSNSPRDDFFKFSFDGYSSIDYGYLDIDIAIAYEPLYELRQRNDYASYQKTHQKELEILENLGILNLLEISHMAMMEVVKSELFTWFRLKKPFYFFIHDHDWSPFLTFVQND
jgi:hypothetical protein